MNSQSMVNPPFYLFLIYLIYPYAFFNNYISIGKEISTGAFLTMLESEKNSTAAFLRMLGNEKNSIAAFLRMLGSFIQQ